MLLRADRGGDGGGGIGDACVAASTGSGKTLAYVLPVVQALAGRVVRRTRALVVAPTRDLVAQVLATFAPYAAALGLRVVALTGQAPFAAEQAALCPGLPRRDDAVLRAWVAAAGGIAAGASAGAATAVATVVVPPPGAALHAAAAAAAGDSGYDESVYEAPDIVVATPGRLMDHLSGTPGFTLTHLRYLVIDEADRLLTQSFQNWSSRIFDAVFRAGGAGGAAAAGVLAGPAVTCRPRLGAPGRGDGGGNYRTPLHAPFRQIICSATLTSNPAKLAALALRSPVYFAAHAEGAAGAGEGADAGEAEGARRYRTPAGLREAMLVCPPTEKPLALIALLALLRGHHVIVFTGSVETTHKVARLLQLFYGGGGGGGAGWAAGDVVEFSSALAQAERSRVLGAARAGDASGGSIIVATDAAARGVDVLRLSAVVQYDCPPRIKTYIHRVGRTARAGRAGIAYTLVHPDQVCVCACAAVRECMSVGKFVMCVSA